MSGVACIYSNQYVNYRKVAEVFICHFYCGSPSFNDCTRHVSTIETALINISHTRIIPVRFESKLFNDTCQSIDRMDIFFFQERVVLISNELS